MRKPTPRNTAPTVTVEAPTTDTALMALNTAPQAGSNSAAAGELLVSVEQAHNAIVEVLAAMADTETTLEYARQKLAYDLWLRHVALHATSPAGSQPTLAMMAGAKNRTVFLKYLAALKVEFTDKQITVGKNTNKADRAKASYQKMVAARLERALTLIVHLDFAGVGLEAFDTERGQWRIPSSMMILPDYKAAPDLLEVPFLYLEANTKEEFYFIQRPTFPSVAVTPSLDFVKRVMDAQIERAHNPLTATVAVGTRGAQLPGSKASDKTPAATDGNATPADASDDDEPGIDDDAAVPMTERSRMSVALARELNNAAKYLAMDTLRNLKREDIGNAAFNSMGDIAAAYNRIVALEEMDSRKRAA